jgi:hypothetical protein
MAWLNRLIAIHEISGNAYKGKERKTENRQQIDNA